jgi:phosphatidate cytidylyltransferase
VSVEPEGANVRPAPPSPGRRIGADLGPRVAAAVVLGVAALAVSWVGGVVFVTVWWIASVAVFWEWQRIVSTERLLARLAAGIVLIAVAALFALHNRALLGVVALAAAAVATGLVAAPERRIWAGAGALYAGAQVVSLGLLEASPAYGFGAILWLFAIVWGADVAAYFAGRTIGGPKLWVRVSPGKTWSGAVAGAVVGAALGLALALALVPGPLRIARVFELGLAAAVVSELGDLFESAVKRRFGVKDSSRLIPGHGGLMDRLDSFIAAAVFAALVAAANTRGSFIASGLFQW